MNPRELKKPNVSESLAADLALRHYGLVVTSIERMVSYDDQNFHIKVSTDHQNPYIDSISPEGYTMKITNTENSAILNHFDSMHGTMVHLHNKGLCVPLPVPNIEGNTWKLERVPLLNEDAEDPKEYCGIHLLTFIPGQPVSTVPLPKPLLFQWGALLAHFHNATEDLVSQHLKKKDVFWNLEHIPDIKSFMEILEEDKKDLVNRVLDQYADLIERNLPNLRKGFIHGDFNENNILVRKVRTEDRNEYEVKGILDFEDIHYATYVWDIGVMMAYNLLVSNMMDPLEGAGHALAGYTSLRALCSLELSLLKMCIMCRLCQSLVLGAYSYSLDPSNSYLMDSARSGWERLKQILNTNEDTLLQKWREIEEEYK